MSEMRVAGWDAPGPPTTGSYTIDDIVIDSAGRIWACTVAGTPGTWTARPIAQAAVADATGGTIVDVEARAALNALLARLRALGLIAP